MPPAALGSKFVTIAVFPLNSEEKNAVGRKRLRGGAKQRHKIAQVDERVGGEDQIVDAIRFAERSLDVSDTNLVIDLSRARLLDHGGAQIDAVEARGQIAKRKAREARAAAEIENRKLAAMGETDQFGEVS